MMMLATEKATWHQTNITAESRKQNKKKGVMGIKII